MNSKDICKELKSIRRSIAQENNIDIDIPDCDFQGHCPGTCPRCEMEAHAIEQKLAERLSLGKMATVAGIALTLAGSVAANNSTEASPQPLLSVEQHSSPDSNFLFRFEIHDKDGVPVYLAAIRVKKDGETILCASSDFDGRVSIHLPNDEAYDIEIYFNSSSKITLSDLRPLPASDDVPYAIVELPIERQIVPMAGVPASKSFLDPSEPHTQHMEIDGIFLKAQY